jgi:hypothetical protein
MISSRFSPSIGPDHDFPSLRISVDHPLYFPNDRLGTPLRNAQNSRRIERRCRPAVVDSDRLPHVVIIRGGAPCLASFARRGTPRPRPSKDWGAAQPGKARLQSCRTPPMNATEPCRDDPTIAGVSTPGQANEIESVP